MPWLKPSPFSQGNFSEPYQGPLGQLGPFLLYQKSFVTGLAKQKRFCFLRLTFRQWTPTTGATYPNIIFQFLFHATSLFKKVPAIGRANNLQPGPWTRQSPNSRALPPLTWWICLGGAQHTALIPFRKDTRCTRSALSTWSGIWEIIII